jgi:cytochrome c oxidase assembly protein subunit 15
MNQFNEGNRSRPVAIWIMVGVAMLLVQVILGGITRLTGSGLSITEWNVVTGLLPPLNANQWLAEFDKYRQTPQYQLINGHFTVSDFKFIFFWEWIHRLWARLIAFAFLFPFVYFLIRKQINRSMVGPLVLLFLFGALQGAIGWIMVKSGLTGDAIYVKPTKLALHFVFALALIALAFWVGLSWLYPSKGSSFPPLKKLTLAIISIIFIQFIFGALLAGHKAAVASPTWPLINGRFFPPEAWRDRPILFNLVNNTIAIHLMHRSLAYIIFLLVLIWTFICYRDGAPDLKSGKIIPAVLVSLQALLGILSLFASKGIVPNHWGAFEWLALTHQIVGMLLLLSMVGILYFLTPKYRTQQL